MFRMRTTYLPIGLLCLSHFFPIARGDSSIILNPDNGHSYQRFDSVMAWHEARAFCEATGGYLATITSEYENYLVWSNIGMSAPHIGSWLGGTDKEVEGVGNG
jgi:hypothetical protein